MTEHAAARTTAGTSRSGPPTIPIHRALPGLWRDPLAFLIDARREHGDIVRLHLGPRTVYLLTHPEYVDHVLHENHRNYRKGPLYQSLRPLLGNGLIASDGDLWRRQRRLMQPAFSRQRLAAFLPTMTEATARMLERWGAAADRGQPLDVAAEMVQLTLTILLRAVFGRDADDRAEAFGRALLTVEQHINPVTAASPIALPKQVPTPGNRRYQQALRELDAFVFRLIDERRRSGQDAGDLLSMLLLARDEETGEGMEDRQLRDEVLTILQAGHEPPSDAITWAWYLLAQYPLAQRQVRAELDAVLGGRPPTAADLPNLTYTTMVLHESMRLYPPGWVIARMATDDDEIGGYHIPANSLVALSPYVTHRHPAFWESPEGFDPERFTPERSEGRPRFAFFPFGGGPRLCMGAPYGMMVAQVIIAMVAQAYRLDLVPGRPVRPRPLISLVPDQTWMTLHRLSGQPRAAFPAPGPQ